MGGEDFPLDQTSEVDKKLAENVELPAAVMPTTMNSTWAPVE